jgi:hypothetical protein
VRLAENSRERQCIVSDWLLRSILLCGDRCGRTPRLRSEEFHHLLETNHSHATSQGWRAKLENMPQELQQGNNNLVVLAFFGGGVPKLPPRPPPQVFVKYRPGGR